VTILASRATRPVRWRRHLRAACFWLALALAAVAVASELAGPLFAVLMLPPLVLAARECVRALGARTGGKLAERVSSALTTALGPDYVVLTEYAPRDNTLVVPVVVVGPSGIFVIEPIGEEGTFACYRDGWHRIEPQGVQHLPFSPSRRARDHAARVRSDISGGGHIRTVVDAYVLLERGTGEHCASSTVPVVCGVEALAGQIRGRSPRTAASPHQVHAVADALIHPLAVATA
jgi:hypothetical protein